MDLATYSFYVDWNNGPGQSPPVSPFTGDHDDISEYVMTASWEYGSDSPAPGDTKAGALRLKLDNSSSIFSSFNSSSDIYGLILPGRLVRVTMTVGVTTVTMWQGYLDTIDPVVGEVVGVSTAELVAYGVLAANTDGRINLAMQVGTTTGEAMEEVLDAAGFASSDYTADGGLTTLDRFWCRDQTVLDLLRELEAAECGLLRESKDGKIQFEDRSHRLSSPHTAVVSTYGSGTLNIWNLRQINPLQGIYNLVESNVRTFNTSEDVVLCTVVDIRLGLGGAPIPIGVGETLVVWMEVPSPSSPTQYIGVDTWGLVTVEVNAVEDGTGADLTSNITFPADTPEKFGNKIKVTLVNTGGAGYIIILKANGNAVVEGDSIPISAEDADSQGNYHKRSLPNPSRWITNLKDGQDYCDHMIALYKDPRPRLQFDLKANYNSTHLAEAQRLDVSDRIHIHALADFGLYINEDFFVEKLVHTVSEARVHTVTVTCGAIVSHVWPACGSAYTPKTIPTGIPDVLKVASIDPSYHCVFGAEAWKYNENIIGARFRAKWFATQQEDAVDLRTVAEGGTLEVASPDDGTVVIEDDVVANHYGAQVEFDSVSPSSPSQGLSGYWYFAFQFKSAAGDSVWSDGNKTPRYVTDFLPTDSSENSGPPSDWWIEVDPDPNAHRVKVRASRPKENGDKIWGWTVQIKDNRSGQWYAIDEGWTTLGAGPDVQFPPYANGSKGWIPMILTLDGRRLTRESGTGLTGPHAGGYNPPDAVNPGDLCLVDVRGGEFDIAHAQWATVDSVQGLKTGYDVWTATYFDVAGRLRPLVDSDLYVMVIVPFWNWDFEGYLGAQPNHGVWNKYFIAGNQHGDTETAVFESDWIDVPSDVPLSAIEARVFFDNGYSISDDGVTHSTGLTGDSGNPSGASGLVLLTHTDESTIPVGQVVVQFNRETVNYKGIWAVAVVFSESLPAEGPYEVEREVSPSYTVLETGTCTIIKGNKAVTVTRSADPEAVGRVFLIYTSDSDLDGEVIVAEAEDSITLSAAFGKSGTFDYAIVRRWWDTAAPDTSNLAYAQFAIPSSIAALESTVWRLPALAAPPGLFYATVYCRNKYGVGTRLTAGPKAVGEECTALSVVGGHVATNASLGTIFRIDTDSAFELDNPSNLVRCGQILLWVITGTGTLTLGDKFNGRGNTLAMSGGRDYLGAIYNAVDDELDIFWDADEP
jgi:hypothetical protein